MPLTELTPVFQAHLWSPFLTVFTAACIVLLTDLFLDRDLSEIVLPAISIVSCLVAFFFLYHYYPLAPGEGRLLFEQYPILQVTPFTRGCVGIILIGAALLLLISPRVIRRRNLPLGEYYSLFLLSVLGMALMACSVELLTFFINLEIVSITLYVLIGLDRRNARSGEAALKYFLLGSFASSFFIFGAAFFYGYAHTTFLAQPAAVNLEHYGPFIALALILAALAFKITLAPFHLYAADVYDGAPTPISALLATGVKVAGFAGLTQLLLHLKNWYALGLPAEAALVFLALVSIIIGNAVALTQTRIKRLLAYSSIAHSGYLLLGVLALLQARGATVSIMNAIETYLLAYVIMNVVAFGVVASLGERYENEIANYAGLARAHPFEAAVLSVALISLTGLPPTIGFIGKLYVFAEVVETKYLYTVIIAVLASVISACYYLRVIVTMYMSDEELELRGEKALANDLALGLGTAMILIFGALPALLFWLY